MLLFLLVFLWQRHVKVYSLENYEPVHTIDYPSPVLSLSLLVWRVLVFACYVYIFLF